MTELRLNTNYNTRFETNASYDESQEEENTEKDDEENETELYLKKHKISSIYNKVSIIVDNEPIEVGIDTYNKLIDTNSEDNRRKL